VACHFVANDRSDNGACHDGYRVALADAVTNDTANHAARDDRRHAEMAMAGLVVMVVRRCG